MGTVTSPIVRPTSGAEPDAAGDQRVVQQPLALYVHIPFCQTKCPYCDFNTYAGIEPLMPAYVKALAHEITQWGVLLGKPELGTISYGGGTPSYLPTRDLGLLMRATGDAFRLQKGAEVALEANPGDMSLERAKAMRRAGFNRISVGVQSLDDQELRLLGRRHTADQAKHAVTVARRAGFDDVNVDLIFGLPYQFLATWEHTLEEAIALGPDHFSLYALTLEPGTPMEADVRSGRLPEPDSDLAAEMYLLAQRALAEAGYEQFEISNWSKPGHASRHNLVYWRNGPYLGVGPGAHSYLVAAGAAGAEEAGGWGVRFAGVRSPKGYMSAVQKWQAPATGLSLPTLRNLRFLESVEPLDQATAMAEMMMMGLRLNEGVSDAEFRSRFGLSIAEQFPRAVSDCLELGLLEWADGWLRLTEPGRLLGNEAFGRFVGAGRAATE